MSFSKPGFFWVFFKCEFSGQSVIWSTLFYLFLISCWIFFTNFKFCQKLKWCTGVAPSLDAFMFQIIDEFVICFMQAKNKKKRNLILLSFELKINKICLCENSHHEVYFTCVDVRQISTVFNLKLVFKCGISCFHDNSG